jgi:hypothetical protein
VNALLVEHFSGHFFIIPICTPSRAYVAQPFLFACIVVFCIIQQLLPLGIST